MAGMETIIGMIFGAIIIAGILSLVILHCQSETEMYLEEITHRLGWMSQPPADPDCRPARRHDGTIPDATSDGGQDTRS